jgi:hypothetical protein
LGGKVIVTEKIDGANVGIIRHKDYFKLQKRGSLVDASEHYQFNFLKAWSQLYYEKLMQIPEGMVLYGELMICKHTIFYDLLPDYFIAFALADRKKNAYLHRDEMVELCDKIGLHYVPELYRGTGLKRDKLFNLIPNPSAYGSSSAEGIVVWNYNAGIRGKVVREEFHKSMDNDSRWMRKGIVKNLLKKE